jgi:pyruvate kinase
LKQSKRELPAADPASFGRRAKIICTIGPACNSEEAMRDLMRMGMDVARLNFSHGTHDDHAANIERLRRVATEENRTICILQDLQGPKIRTGRLIGHTPVAIKTGSHVTITPREVDGTPTLISTTFKTLASEMKPGARILLSDGLIELRLVSRRGNDIICEVINGGFLGEHQGINLPGAALSIPALTPKDRKDLDFGLKHAVDMVALSFVRSAADVQTVKRIIAKHGSSTPVIAKLEKPQALEHLEEIFEASDGVMVARGDLGVELPLEAVPGRQKQIIRAARRAGKPVVVATQMLESMIHTAVPTRAEVSDVANAVFEGADAVMLSAETASGAYPVEAVAMMDRIAQAVENDPVYRNIIEAQRQEPEATIADGLLAAVRDVTHTIKASAIVCWTKSGSTGLRAARERPEAPILALTPIKAMARRLTLAWGLHCVETEDAQDLDDVAERACEIAYEQGFAKPGERVVITAGLPLGTPGATNMLRVAFVPRKSN